MELNGKTVLLTGASGGIGRAIAHELASAGAQLMLCGRNPAALEALDLPGRGHQVVVADVTTQLGRAALVSALDARPLDILINNAGVNQLALLEGMSDLEVEQQMATNLTAPILLTKALLSRLQRRPEAMVVNVGSALGSIGMAGSVPYCASKFGLRGFSEALRRELADTSVKVLYFAPRATATALNSDATNALNAALKTTVDRPEEVAAELLQTMQKSRPRNHYLGWPEKFFVRLNALLPGLVDGAVRKQLPVIKRFAR